MPQALAVLHDAVRAGNQALDSEELPAAADLHGQVLAMAQVLGIDPRDPHWAADARPRGIRPRRPRLTPVDDRSAARDAKDWASADRIRAELAGAGITIEDSQTGTHWSLTS